MANLAPTRRRQLPPCERYDLADHYIHGNLFVGPWVDTNTSTSLSPATGWTQSIAVGYGISYNATIAATMDSARFGSDSSETVLRAHNASIRIRGNPRKEGHVGEYCNPTTHQSAATTRVSNTDTGFCKFLQRAKPLPDFGVYPGEKFDETRSLCPSGQLAD